MTYRTGLGYDIHRLQEGRTLIIGGVEIPFELGLAGHSDADVLIHALIDAILGAMALGDIGKHFPSSDNRYKNIDSTILLGNINKIIADNGYRIENIDANIIAERPKMAPFIDPMREKLSNILKIEMQQISIKAKTMERLGPIGDSKAIASQVIILLEKIC